MLSRDLLVYLSLVSSLWVGAMAYEVAFCPPGWEWNRNSHDQDPCKLASVLGGACRNQISYDYQKMWEKGQYYVPPRKNETYDMTCDCNTIIYSLVMACGTCQDGIAYGWERWSTPCEGVYISQYPSYIPQGTAVPRWVYFDVTTLPDGIYTDVNARTIGRDPEVKPDEMNTLSKSSTLSTSSTSGKSEEPTATGVVGGGSKSSGSNTGVIIGGAVGGVAFLIIIAFIIFFIVARRRKNRNSQPQPQQQYQEAPFNPWKSPPGSPPYSPGSTSTGPTPAPPLQHYNPGDPSTFPPALGDPGRPPVTYVTRYSNYGGEL